MSIEELRAQGWIILECLSGSKAYGLDTPDSDTDIKGVFLLPKEKYYGLNYIPQINNESNDIVFYELGRFLDLLAQNNPNILELLNSPENAIIYKHPLMEMIRAEKILSKQCANTFGKFALSQIRKARGLKKKIVNPIAKQRKSVLAFCYVNYQNSSIPLNSFLKIKGWEQEQCGLTNIAHMTNIYGLYHHKEGDYNGIVRSEGSNDVSLSSIPKGAQQEALLYFNRNGYSTYCKEYKDYWEWVEKRNENRYQSTLDHGKNYDAKNMMHVFRLLDMAIEIASYGKVSVKRPNRDFLLKIKAGGYEYQDLLNMAEKRQKKMKEAFEKTSLQSTPDLDYINELAYQLRDAFYNQV